MKPDPVLVFAILSLGAFVGVLVTTLFYVYSVRPRLESTPESAPRVQEAEPREQPLTLAQLNAALHTARFQSDPAESARLEADMAEQSSAIHALTNLVTTQTTQLTALDDHLGRVENRLASWDALDRMEARFDALDRRLSEPPPAPDQSELATAIQAQSAALKDIRALLDTPASSVDESRWDAVLSDLDTRVSEHTTMLVTAATERREQASLIDRILERLGEVFPILNQILSTPVHPEQDRLTDIKGIGPVYAGKLYEAGVHTYRQLAAMSPEMISMIIDEPEWRARSIDAADWIRQANLMAAQREKVERIR